MIYKNANKIIHFNYIVDWPKSWEQMENLSYVPSYIITSVEGNLRGASLVRFFRIPSSLGTWGLQFFSLIRVLYPSSSVFILARSTVWDNKRSEIRWSWLETISFSSRTSDRNRSTSSRVFSKIFSVDRPLVSGKRRHSMNKGQLNIVN